MQNLIEAIRTAVGADATIEHKAAGATACRTILAALDTAPGTPFTMPGAPPTPGPRVSVDQVLDLMISRLTTIASEHDRHAQEAPQALHALAAPSAPEGVAPVAARGLRIPAARLPIAAPRKPPQTKPTTRPVRIARKP